MLDCRCGNRMSPLFSSGSGDGEWYLCKHNTRSHQACGTVAHLEEDTTNDIAIVTEYLPQQPEDVAHDEDSETGLAQREAIVD